MQGDQAAAELQSHLSSTCSAPTARSRCELVHPETATNVWIKLTGRRQDGKRGMENALRAKPEDVREQYERQLKDLQEAYGEAMLEIRARKKLASLLGKDES